MKKFDEIGKLLLGIIGASIVGIAEAWILIPTKLTTGGINGIGMLLYYLQGVPVALFSVIMNIPIFLLGLKKLGKDYCFKSLVCMLALSLMLMVGAEWKPLTDDLLLASIFGSALIGIGLAITFKAGCSTGGTDIIAKLIQSKYKYLNMGEIIFIIDAIIIAAAAVTFDSIEIALYSAIAVFVMTKVIDFILDGGKYEKAVFIISKNDAEISKFIMNGVGRGVTYLDGKGGYTGEEEHIIFCIVNKRELPKIKDAVKELDKKAFVIVTTVSEAIGQGFQENF